MKSRTIRKVLVANRGEIAVRIIRTCKELGVETVAIYSDADRAMPHVAKADEAYRIGPPPSRESYLCMDRIIDVARKTECDAIHPGYGFLSENAEFARKVSEAGLAFVGPPTRAIQSMGDKTEARKLVAAAGVPVVPGTPGPIDSVEEARLFSDQVGFPVLIKAAAGGGGKGMRVVEKGEELAGAFRAAQSEAASAFGDGRLYVEKYLEHPRHVEIQILADQYGNAVHLGERECSIQRRHQKVVEESPSLAINGDVRDRMGGMAVQTAKACGYVNAGTVEFLVDQHKSFYFLEMNTRLQVEHPITEMRTGLDLVALQLRIAMGERLPFTQEQLVFSGHAIECRICAEDVLSGFMPSTGRILHIKPPQGPNIREDGGLDAGCEVPVYYDPMIGKLVAWGPTRNVAISRMERALTEYEILGVRTNLSFCLFVLRHPAFRQGDYDTGFVGRHFTLNVIPQLNEQTAEAVSILCATLEAARQHDTEPRPSAVVSNNVKTESTNHAPKNWRAQRNTLMRGWRE